MNSYYIKNYKNSISNKESIIMGEKYRITLLTDNLVRLEYNKKGKFEDRPTQKVINRKFEKPNFTIYQTETLIQIVTPFYKIDYVKNKNFNKNKLDLTDNVKISILNSEKTWSYNKKNKKEYISIAYSLDNYPNNIKRNKGLYSKTGFAVLDDTNSKVLTETGELKERDNKELDIYVFIYGKDFSKCINDYFKITGYPKLLPRYAYDNWWYKNDDYDKLEIINLVNKFRENNISISTILMGNFWHNEGDLMFFKNKLDITNLTNILNGTNIHMGVTLNPEEEIKKDTGTYQVLEKDNIINKNTKLLPFSNETQNIYTNYIIKNIIANKMEVINIDYNNIKDKNTLDILVRKIKDSYKLYYNKRNIVISRNHEYSPHTDTLIITGKTKVDWDTLKIIPEYISSSSNMGISYITTPIGGFSDGIENFELYIRYIELGTFLPVQLLASDQGKYYKREPWKWDISQLEIIEKYLKLRTMLIPYIYSESFNYHKYGSPIIQPLYYKYPKIYEDKLYKNEYYFGSELLICPITKKKNELIDRTVQKIFIPEGIWYNMLDGKKYIGNKYYDEFYQEEDYPVFCKAGSIIPLSLDNNSNTPINLELNIYPGANGEYNLYEDDGISYDYETANYAITNIKYTYTEDCYQLSIEPSNNIGILPSLRNYYIKFKNTRKENITVRKDNIDIQFEYLEKKSDLILIIKNVGRSEKLNITLTGKNLESSPIQVINDDIKKLLISMKLETELKDEIDKILFSNETIKDKKKKIKKLRIEPKFKNLFIGLLNYIKKV